MTKFFVNHPELQEGEVFLTNIFELKHFHQIGWVSKREGNVAYDYKGEILSNGFPVFVKRDELEKNGVDPDKIW